MTENQRKIAELNRVYDELQKQYDFVLSSSEATNEQKAIVRKKLTSVINDRMKILNKENRRLCNLK